MNDKRREESRVNLLDIAMIENENNIDMITQDNIRKVMKETIEQVMKSHSIDYLGREQKIDITDKEQLKKLAKFHLIFHFSSSIYEAGGKREKLNSEHFKKLVELYDKNFDDIYKECMIEREKNTPTQKEYDRMKRLIKGDIERVIKDRGIKIRSKKV